MIDTHSQSLRACKTCTRRKSTEPRALKDVVSPADTSGMTKSVAASVVCLLPLLAACPPDSSRCGDLGTDLLVEVDKDSEALNVGDCKVPSAFRLGALGCNGATTYSADKCVISFDLMCIGNTDITMDVTQTADDGVVGTLHKESNGCSLDLDITIKNTPAPKLDETK